MNSEDLKEKICKIKIWKKHDQRAPHKPLLILYALGKLQMNNSQFYSYEEVKKDLTDLLIEFGPSRNSYHPEEPFVRLTTDGLWSLNVPIDKVQINNKWLLNNEIIGGFNEEVYSLLKNNHQLIKEISENILNQHFPETIHEDILRKVGLDFKFRTYKQRDPKFREKILYAYEERCAVCGFSVRLGDSLVAVEAAHIKWHQAGGPDIEDNGLALCSMHHKLFDRGVFTLTQANKVIVADNAHGTNGFDEWVMKYQGRQVREPVNIEYKPRDSFINWHVKEVFKGKVRYKIV